MEHMGGFHIRGDLARFQRESDIVGVDDLRLTDA
jgi:hypothetical protein